jgi:hypothetical protein
MHYTTIDIQKVKDSNPETMHYTTIDPQKDRFKHTTMHYTIDPKKAKIQTHDHALYHQ